MLAHRLRHRITFQRPVNTKNPVTGEDTTTWQTAQDDDSNLLLDVPAEVLTGPGREFVQAGAKQAETSARINLRWFPVDRTELYAWRILWDGRVFDIGSAETDITARQEWRLKCTDGVNDG